MAKVTSGPGSVVVRKRSKYNNRHTHADGLHFDSKKEEARYHQLKTMVESGDINSMEVHPRFYFFLNGKPGTNVTKLAELPPGGFFYDHRAVPRCLYFRLATGAKPAGDGAKS